MVFDDNPKYNLAMFKEEDVDFKTEWLNYHNKHCNLQILRKDCNLQKAKISDYGTCNKTHE